MSRKQGRLVVLDEKQGPQVVAVSYTMRVLRSFVLRAVYSTASWAFVPCLLLVAS